MSDIGKTIWARHHAEKGIVVNTSERYCAVCGRASCLIVEWADKKKTKPCLHGVKYLPNGDLEIM